MTPSTEPGLAGAAARLEKRLEERKSQLARLVALLKPQAARKLNHMMARELERHSCAPPAAPGDSYYAHMDRAVALLATALAVTPPAALHWPIPGIEAAASATWLALAAEAAAAARLRLAHRARRGRCTPASPLLLRTEKPLNPQLVCSLALHREHADLPSSLRRLCSLRERLEDPREGAAVIAALLGRRDAAQLLAEVERLESTHKALRALGEALAWLNSPAAGALGDAVAYQKAAKLLRRLDGDQLAYAQLPPHIDPRSLGGPREAAALLEAAARALRGEDPATLLEALRDAVQRAGRSNIYIEKAAAAYRAATAETRPRRDTMEALKALARRLEERREALRKEARRLRVEAETLRREILAAAKRARLDALRAARQAAQHLAAQPKARQAAAASHASGMEPTKLWRKSFLIKRRASLRASLREATYLVLLLAAALATALGAAYKASPHAAELLAAALALMGAAGVAAGYARHRRLLVSGAWITLTLLALQAYMPIYLASAGASAPPAQVLLSWLTATLGILLMTAYALATIINMPVDISHTEMLIIESNSVPCSAAKHEAPRSNTALALLKTICIDIEKIDKGDLEAVAVYTGPAAYAKYKSLTEIEERLKQAEKQEAAIQRAIAHIERTMEARHALLQRRYVEAAITLQKLAHDLQDQELRAALGIEEEDAEAATSLLRSLADKALLLALGRRDEAQSQAGNRPQAPPMYKALQDIIDAATESSHDAQPTA